MNISDFIKFCEEKGFFYSSEKIYGGVTGFYDYGSLGKIIELKFENLWRKYFLKLYDNFWEIETSEIMKEEVFEASGHLKLFNDPIVECKKGHRHRADKLIEEKLGIKAESLTIDEMNKLFENGEILCPDCGSKLSKVRLFNLMIPTVVGPEQNIFLVLEDFIKNDNFEKEKLFQSYREFLENRYFLRPETAQGAYVNFPIEIIINRYRLPIGLAIIGKAYRNEISPRNALLRMREFRQAELQIFFDYNDFDDFYERIKENYLNVLLFEDREKNIDFKKIKIKDLEYKLPKSYLYFMYKIQRFYLDVLKIPEDKIRFFELSENEKSFYNMYHFDIEIFVEDLGWIEVGGIHFRVIKVRKKDLEILEDKKLKENLLDLFNDKEEIMVGYDLWNHMLKSKNTGFIVLKNNKKIVPLELELSFGIDRNIFSIIRIFYDEKENVLRLPIYLSPIEVSIFPLLESNEKHVNKAKEVYNLLKYSFNVYYDDSGSIGKRYKRQDSIGTPFCITIDEQTFVDNSVTIRFRDTREQIRIKIDEIKKLLKEKLSLDFLEEVIKDM
ncbi:MAG: His/Gly/Thr/Pro-type tRNA ligase C-terminal domain-containing protein [Nanopusillaceae archaeon]